MSSHENHKQIPNIRIHSTRALIALFLSTLLLSVFFSDILPYAGMCEVISLFLCFTIALIRKPLVIKLQSNRNTFLLWLVFLIFIIANRGQDLLLGASRKWLYEFVPCLLLSKLLEDEGISWIEIVATITALLATVHALATTILFIRPELYTSLYSAFFAGRSIPMMGYKSGLTGHYSTNGLYLAFGVISALSLSIRNNAYSKQWLMVMFVNLFALLLTTKRGHLVFCLCACVLMYLLSKDRSGIGNLGKLLTLVTVITLLYYILSQYIPEISYVIDRLLEAKDDETFGGRADYYKICMDLWKRNPLFGNGWGTFTTTLYKSGLSGVRSLIMRGNLTQKAHNVYIQLLAEEGVVGLAIYCTVIGLTFINTVNLIRSDRIDHSKRSLLYSIGMQLFFILYAMTGNPLYSSNCFIIYLLSCSTSFISSKNG